jgi:beta-N-acetylhexosaminidase
VGPLFIDLHTVRLDGEERELLEHPLVGGVILFSRNFEAPKQLLELNKSIRKAAKEPILIGVDHEGGRVQRFEDGFSKIPAMGEFQAIAERHQLSDTELAKQLAWLMAVELRACDVDLSFAPVLDLNGISEVIGTRSFSPEPDKVVSLGRAWCQGMHLAGMKTTAKHFPGHGSVAADSHIAQPVDGRSFEAIEQRDLTPFMTLIQEAAVDAVMPAHVIYPQCCDKPAGFSNFWLKDILRERLGFEGIIFSDDLSMKAAHQAGSAVSRANAALEAGCDMLLACNDRDSSIAIIDGLPPTEACRGQSMFAIGAALGLKELATDSRVQSIRNRLTSL